MVHPPMGSITIKLTRGGRRLSYAYATGEVVDTLLNLATARGLN